jgi:hypothetical protein
MSVLRFAKVAALCGTVVLAVWSGVQLAGFYPAIVETTAAVPVGRGSAAVLAADVELAGAPQAAAMCSASAVNADVAPASVVNTDVAPASVVNADVAPASVVNADVAPVSVVNADAALAAEPETAMATGTIAVPDRPKLFVEAAPFDSSPSPAAELPLVQMASADPSDPLPDAVKDAAAPIKQAVARIEILDECLVADACIDRYLWALYQRTPKEDSMKVRELRKVTIKRRGKLVTVTRSFTRLVDQDFTWKDPKAAERTGMSMMDYVIGGMDRSFKTKLFHALYAADQAGMSPGITSAFRDDYRQSIASGMKAATDRSYHGGSFRGGYGHGLAADVVSVDGATRNQRWASTEKFWKWIDAHGKEFGIGRPYLGRDPPHVGPTDGREYAAHNPGMRMHAEAVGKKHTRLAMRDSAAKTPAKRTVVQGTARPTRQAPIPVRSKMAMAEPGRG